MVERGILLVDDDPAVLRVLHAILSDYPRVRFATNGADALALMREEQPDLVLLDAEMPGMSGFEVCAAIKDDPVLRHIAVIFVTSHDDVSVETRALGLGAADFLGKPLSGPRVRLRVALHLHLKRQVDLLRNLSEVDALTGLVNRRGLDAAVDREARSSRRSNLPLSALMVDVDDFKRFNDRYGHPAGDACLRALADVLRTTGRRPRDLAARYGGEEFTVLLPETDGDGAMRVAHAVCRSVEALAIPHDTSRVADHVTVSVGVATLPDDCEDGRRLIDAADRALYAAKQAGRNRAVRADDA